MKNFRKIFYLLLVPMFFMASCEDDSPDLGQMLDKSEIDFEVVQDLAIDEGGNTVILKNLTPETLAMWDYGTGRSTRMVDTVRFPFKGEYTIKFSAVTGGGIVKMDPVTIEVTEDNLMYVNDPLWTLLSGGVGNEKTWLMDANANGDSKFFTSPVYFAGQDNAYGTTENNEIVWTQVCEVPDGPDCWVYPPNYKVDTWAAPFGDYGTMTFSLKGGAVVTTVHKMIPGKGTETGTYFLDVNTNTLSMTNATPLTVPYGPTDAVSLNNMRILSLTENTMQLAFKNKAKPEYFVINYISKEYSDNWVPKEQKDPNFDHGDQSEILSVNTSKTWYLDQEVPFNWTDLEGNFLNPWSSRADYPDWAAFGDGDVAGIDNASITFSADGKVVVTQDDGTVQEGEYEIDEPTNIITFSEVKPSIPIGGWAKAETTAENQWKIVKVEEEINGRVTGIWLGQRAPEKAEYMVFHFVQR